MALMRGKMSLCRIDQICGPSVGAASIAERCEDRKSLAAVDISSGVGDGTLLSEPSSDDRGDLLRWSKSARGSFLVRGDQMI